KKCTETAVCVTIAQPNSRFETKEAHTLQCLVGEEVIHNYKAERPIQIHVFNVGGIPFIREYSLDTRCVSNMYYLIVNVPNILVVFAVERHSYIDAMRH